MREKKMMELSSLFISGEYAKGRGEVKEIGKGDEVAAGEQEKVEPCEILEGMPTTTSIELDELQLF